MSSNIRISADSIFAYMDYLESGFSPEQIDQAILEPIQEEADLFFQEEVERVQSILQSRLIEKESEASELFAQVEGVDITEAAKTSLKEQRKDVKALRAFEEDLSSELHRSKEKLEQRRVIQERLRGGLENLRTTLHAIQIEPRFVTVLNEVGKAGSLLVAEKLKEDT
jgi:hypothetical protein